MVAMEAFKYNGRRGSQDVFIGKYHGTPTEVVWTGDQTWSGVQKGLTTRVAQYQVQTQALWEEFQYKWLKEKGVIPENFMKIRFQAYWSEA